MTSNTQLEADQAAHIAQLQREINTLRTLLSAMIEAWRAPDTGSMVRLVAEAEKTLLTKQGNCSNLTTWQLANTSRLKSGLKLAACCA